MNDFERSAQFHRHLMGSFIVGAACFVMWMIVDLVKGAPHWWINPIIAFANIAVAAGRWEVSKLLKLLARADTIIEKQSEALRNQQGMIDEHMKARLSARPRPEHSVN